MTRGKTALFACALGAMLVTGCTSLRSAQQPVVSTQDILASLKPYSWPDAIAAYHSADARDRGGLTQRQYRDLVITLYMNAIDAQYADFQTSADSESRTSAIGFDLALLGLTGVASVAEADEVGPLAAAIAAFTGARSSFDKNLFFNQSLPAMFAAMEEERAKRRLVLVQAMQRDVESYPLPLAIGDIAALQRAGSFALAISKITRQAVTAKNDAELRLDKATSGCDVVEDVQASTRELRAILVATRNSDPAIATDNRDLLAAQFNLPDGLSEIELRDQIGAKLNSDYCKTADRAAKVANVKSQLGIP
ncbi:MAG: hypothetical protein HEQ21_07535 [Blastomonas sp.]|jgi:hypothetical protein|uniref:hypothetical protein n=1 Tax=Blastomonas TaxID=150203 RepID=UPI002583EF1A|nr:hypothetical protein [Blastomonas sp.]MCO5792656.1 hypothetical protein [Blastomonas sp.]